MNIHVLDDCQDTIRTLAVNPDALTVAAPR